MNRGSRQYNQPELTGNGGPSATRINTHEGPHGTAERSALGAPRPNLYICGPSINFRRLVRAGYLGAGGPFECSVNRSIASVHAPGRSGGNGPFPRCSERF